MSDNVKNIIWILLASILIAVFFLMGGCSKNIETTTPEDGTPPNSTSTLVAEETQGNSQENPEDTGAVAVDDSKEDDSTKIDFAKNDQEKPTVIIDKTLSCEITITCEILVSNPQVLPTGKRELIPSDGIILPPTKVDFKKGASVFDILARATKDNGIHMEFVKTPLYNSAYIEGIHNIYEFDGGEASGWMYSVNGKFPQSGASTYKIEPDDQIHWVYSCDLGKDVGGYLVNQKEE